MDGANMMKRNCMNTVVGAGPLIHEVHGEPYKIVRAVYMALPWLWSKFGMLTGSLVNTYSMKTTLTTVEPTQLLPYPQFANMHNIRNSALWAVTNDGTRRYKYRNCYLTEAGLMINIDLQAPENQRGMKVVWTLMLANHAHKHMHFCPPAPPMPPYPWDCDEPVPPFHYNPPYPYPPAPGFPTPPLPPGQDGEFPPFPFDQP